jgi:fructose-bisphosphate aldolase class I
MATVDVGTLEDTARAMVAPGKGILAMDESAPTCAKRFAGIGVESTEENRRAYREMLITTPGVSEYVSGAILFDETIRQKASDGRPLADVLKTLGIIPGIKVDAGKKPLGGAPGEVVTEGLDKLADRLHEYRDMGARFTKWRAVIRIGAGMPTSRCIEANAHALRRRGQDLALPIVGQSAHGRVRHTPCQEVTEEVLHTVFGELRSQRCRLEGIVLKPSMVIPGEGCLVQADAREIAQLTLQTLRRCVPAAVPGIAFLSGGQTGEEACSNLNAMNCGGPQPWELTYSFGRALQYPALEIWR